MKNFIYKSGLLFLSILILSLMQISCSDDSSTGPKEEGDLVIDQDLVGTWELTKIIAKFGTTPLELTPEQAGISNTVTFEEDLSFESTSTEGDTTTVDLGTWGTNNGILTITINGEEPETSPYSIVGNVATIQSTVPYQGLEINADLEFTKQ
ncbi:MAG: lipocalin family protein [Ignavibacteriales bacterium]|nr:lipocalin family protein [Ignavibacteriales bacterium]